MHWNVECIGCSRSSWLVRSKSPHLLIGPFGSLLDGDWSVLMCAGPGWSVQVPSARSLVVSSSVLCVFVPQSTSAVLEVGFMQQKYVEIVVDFAIFDFSRFESLVMIPPSRLVRSGRKLAWQPPHLLQALYTVCEYAGLVLRPQKATWGYLKEGQIGAILLKFCGKWRKYIRIW